MHHRKPVFSAKATITLLFVCVLAFACAVVFAQDAEIPGKKDKVWALEAATIAKSLGLTAEQTAKLTDAYKAGRESQIKAIQAKREQGGGRLKSRDSFDVGQAESAKLEKALNAFLKPEQTAKAIASLGKFNSTWDKMVAVLDGMKLEVKMDTEAMNLVTAFVVESGKAMKTAADAEDMKSGRDNVAKLKEKLDADMAGILSAEQIKIWTVGTTRQRKS